MQRKHVGKLLGALLVLGCSVPTPGAGGGTSPVDKQSSSSAAASSSSSSSSSSSTGGGSLDPSSSSGAASSSSSSSSSGDATSGTLSSSSSGGVDSSGASSSTGGPALPGDTCQTAVSLEGVDLMLNQTTVGMANNYDGTNSQTCWGGRSPDRVFRMDVPAGKRLLVDAIPAADFDVALNLFAGPAERCDAPPYECLDGTDVASTGGLETVQYSNGGSQAQTVFVIVEGYMGAVGQFSLRVSLQDVLPGDACATATDLTAGMHANQTTVGFTNQNDSSSPAACRGGDAPDRMYRVTIPAQQRLLVTATPEAGFDVVLNVVDGPATACDAATTRTCLDAADAHASGVPEHVQFTNTSLEDRVVFVMVDGFLDTQGSFALNVELGPIPQGGTCANADELTMPANVTGSTLGFGSSLIPHSSCTGYTNDGQEHVYRVEIPANTTLRANVYPVGSWDPSLYVLPGPAANCDAQPLVCLVGADQSGADMVSFANTSASPRTVFVVVDHAYGDGGAYNLQATFNP